jgi:hypothetical protein
LFQPVFLQFLDGFKPSRILEIFVVCQEMAKNRSNPVTRLQSPAGERKKRERERERERERVREIDIDFKKRSMTFVLKRKKRENKKKKKIKKKRCYRLFQKNRL